MGNFCFRSTAAQSRRAAGAHAAQRTHRKHSAAQSRRASSPSQRRGAAEASKMPCCGPAGRSRTRRARSEGRTDFRRYRQLEEPIRAVGSGRGDRGRVESAGPAPKWRTHPAAPKPNSAFSREPNPTKPEMTLAINVGRFVDPTLGDQRRNNDCRRNKVGGFCSIRTRQATRS